MQTLRRVLLAEGFQGATVPVLSVALALAVCYVIIGINTPADRADRWERPKEAYRKLAEGGLGVKFDEKTKQPLPPGPLAANRALGETFLKMALLVLTGLAVALPLRAGLFNIGGEGQFLVGAIVAAYFGWRLSLPVALHPIVVMLLAMASGGLYGAIPGALKVWRGVHEVISTIMLNWIAFYLISEWLVTGPLLVTRLTGARSGAANEAGTPLIRDSAHLWRFFDTSNRMNAGILIAAGLAAAAWVFLRFTRVGFEVRAVGAGPEAARAAGIPVGRRRILAMALAGSLAGLAGSLYVLGTEWRYAPAMQSGYGFDGIAISLLGGNHPLGVLPAALFLGAVRAGITRLQAPPLQIHKSFADLLQGIAILFVTAQYVFRWGIAKAARVFGPEEAIERA